MERIHCIRIYTNLNKEDNFYVSDLLSYFFQHIPIVCTMQQTLAKGKSTCPPDAVTKFPILQSGIS